MTPERTRVCLLLCALWCLIPAAPAGARVRQASDSVIDSRTQHVLDAVPASGLALPPFLRTPKDVYLLVTAGAAYTDVRVVGGPGTSGLALARALEIAVIGTSLADQAVQWSDEDRPAAQVTQGHGHFLARTGANTIPVDALTAGLRRAGYVPHLLLRIPRYARPPGLPVSHFGTHTVRWYDAKQVAGRSPLTLRARLSARDMVLAVCPALIFPLLALVGTALVLRAGRNERLPIEVRRRWFAFLIKPGLFVLLLALPLMVVFGVTSGHLLLLSDLWLGSGS